MHELAAKMDDGEVGSCQEDGRRRAVHEEPAIHALICGGAVASRDKKTRYIAPALRSMTTINSRLAWNERIVDKQATSAYRGTRSSTRTGPPAPSLKNSEQLWQIR